MSRFIKITITMFVLFSAVGCRVAHPPIETLVPMSQVVRQYNANAARVPRLWARVNIVMTYRENPDSVGVSWGSTMDDPNGLLILNKADDSLGPHDFILQIKELGQRIGQLGTSRKDGAYYMWVNFGERRQCRWGHLRLAGMSKTSAMPIDPTQLLAALGICQLPANQTRPPFVAQTICFDPPAYVLTFVDRQPTTGKFKFRREMYFRWSQTKARRPFMVKFFNDLGLVVLTAKMSDYREITLEDVDDNAAQKPVMPTNIKLTWHETGSELHLVLSEMTTAEKFDPDVFLLHYGIPEALRRVARQVDAALAGPRPLPVSKLGNGDEIE